YGCIEFIDHRENAYSLPIEVQKLQEALKILKSTHGKTENSPPLNLSPLKLAEKIIDLSARLHSAQEELKRLFEEKKQIIPFGNINLEEVREIEKAS
ncbi:hypothetical protein ABTM45_19000, partial [Acinetobacter baumannii]